MSRRVTGAGRRDRGPGFAPFPRFPVARANDLVRADVPPATVRAALRARGIAVVDRDRPVARVVVAVVSPTAAGTIVTLQRRGDLRNPRLVLLRRLTRELDDLVRELDSHARDPRNPG